MLLKVIIMKSIVFNNCHVDIRAERIFKAGIGAFWFYDGKLYYNEEMNDRELLLKLGNKIRYERVHRHLSQEKLAELLRKNGSVADLINEESYDILIKN